MARLLKTVEIEFPRKGSVIVVVKTCKMHRLFVVRAIENGDVVLEV